jgi:hypothetical protein
VSLHDDSAKAESHVRHATSLDLVIDKRNRYAEKIGDSARVEPPPYPAKSVRVCHVVRGTTNTLELGAGLF